METQIIVRCLNAVVAALLLTPAGCASRSRSVVKDPAGAPGGQAMVASLPGPGEGSPAAAAALAEPGAGRGRPAKTAPAPTGAAGPTLPEAPQQAARMLRQVEDSLSVAPDPSWRFYKMVDLARLACDAGDVERARYYATEVLVRAPQFEADFQYAFAIHLARTVLGRVELKAGDTA